MYWLAAKTTTPAIIVISVVSGMLFINLFNVCASNMKCAAWMTTGHPRGIVEQATIIYTRSITRARLRALADSLRKRITTRIIVAIEALATRPPIPRMLVLQLAHNSSFFGFSGWLFLSRRLRCWSGRRAMRILDDFVGLGSAVPGRGHDQIRFRQRFP
jgi:hypothetical protein